jgi:hypothetical protein
MQATVDIYENGISQPTNLSPADATTAVSWRVRIATQKAHTDRLTGKMGSILPSIALYIVKSIGYVSAGVVTRFKRPRCQLALRHHGDLSDVGRGLVGG